ncbi:MAG: SDR family oxidoreductase [Candidatus Woesearchaeota archaeon]
MATILITGGTRRLGRALALYYAEQGETVLVVYKDDKKAMREMQKLALIIGKKIHAFQTDLTKENLVKKLFSKIKQQYGELDLLINTVGMFCEQPALELDKKTFLEVFESNVITAFLCSKYAFPLLKGRKGSIINIGYHDVEKAKPYPNILPYAIAKQGVVLVTKTLAKEGFADKIRVNMISPGIMFNNISKRHITRKEIPLGRKGDFEDIIQAVDFLIHDKYITGQNIIVDGGFSL